MDYFYKPYDAGYEARETDGFFSGKAVLETPRVPSLSRQETHRFFIPRFLTVAVTMTVQEKGGVGLKIEHIMNKRSGGGTPLYEPGQVLRDGSETLKPFSKGAAVDFCYGGRGFFMDGEDRLCPFYGGHALEKRLGLKVGDRLFRKPFGTCTSSVVFESRSLGEGRFEGIGLGVETYPLYPYGGYVPPRGNLSDFDQVYAYPAFEASQGKTALKLVRSSFLALGGGFPPTPFSQDHKHWVFPHAITPLEQMTLGQALCEGHLTVRLGVEGGHVRYQSYDYTQPGGSIKDIQVHCVRQRKEPSP